jgi:hypothetical protein
MWDILQEIGRGIKSLGINESTTTAGLLGGTVRGLIIKGGWLNGIGSALAGAIAANYFATPISLSPTLNVWNWSEGTIGFLVGMGAMLGGEWFLKNLGDWLNNFRAPRGGS